MTKQTIEQLIALAYLALDQRAAGLAQMLRDAETEGEVIELRAYGRAMGVMDHPAILDELARLGM